ncbi:MAG: ATP-binding protein [Lactobacillales bacterium]|jgi:predicted AAA+ superfamily ATPase|nr:ATP-binding protein [Lactobacillales bacterium]
MIFRDSYLKKILPFINTELIKILTGVRRSGKSVMLKLIQKHLLDSGVNFKQFIEINFEQLQFEALLDYHQLNNYLVEKIEHKNYPKVYLFLDEIQEVRQFEKVINSLRATYITKIDIYITGSNAKLLSGELATLLAGRYIHFDIYPFKFSEYLTAKKEQGITENSQNLFNQYIIDGGMPFLTNQDLLPEQRDNYLSDIYNSIVLKDIVQRNEIRETDLLQRIYKFVIGNVGRIFSSQSVVKFLKNEGISTSTNTVNNYINAGIDAYFFIPARRFNLQGKHLMKSQEKYYIVDHGLRQAVIGRNEQDIELILENIVLMELKVRGYNVTVGKANDSEVDFIATKSIDNRIDKLYIQVSYLLASKNTRKREFQTLEKISDNYKKLVLTMDSFTSDQNGIEHHNLVDWLLQLAA